MYVPPWPEDPGPLVILATKRVQVSIASAEMLLAMKIHASRGKQDIDDIQFLLAEVGIDSYAAAIARFERFYEEDPIKDRAVKILLDIFGEPSASA